MVLCEKKSGTGKNEVRNENYLPNILCFYLFWDFGIYYISQIDYPQT